MTSSRPFSNVQRATMLPVSNDLYSGWSHCSHYENDLANDAIISYQSHADAMIGAISHAYKCILLHKTELTSCKWKHISEPESYDDYPELLLWLKLSHRLRKYMYICIYDSNHVSTKGYQNFANLELFCIIYHANNGWNMMWQRE